MSKPTLLVEDRIIPDPDTSQSKIDELKRIKPLNYILDWIEAHVGSANSPSDRILLLRSSTGSGKSTILPPEIFYRFFEKLGRRNVCCTQPRVLTSIEIPKTIIPFHTGSAGRVALKMGDNIGFQNGVVAKRPTRGIIFMTIGVLQQQLNIMSIEDFVDRYSFIIVDEAHERSVGTDLTLFMMKRLIFDRTAAGDRRCPFLIVMSATFDPVKFANYFTGPDKIAPRIIQVAGFTFPITDYALEYDTSNYITAAVDTVRRIHEVHLDDILPLDELKAWKPKEFKTSGWVSLSVQETAFPELTLKDEALKARQKEQVFRDILVFVSGEGDANKIIKGVTNLNMTDDLFKRYPVKAIKLMGVDVETRSQNYMDITLDLKKQKVLAGRETKAPVRRVIVASNVAETGITIDTLRHVVDTGYLKSSEFDPIYRSQLLVTRPVTLGMRMQRRGRVGRKAPGYSYALYTLDTINSLQIDQFPNIIREDVALEVLGLVIRQVDTKGVLNERPLHELVGSWAESLEGSEVDIYKFDLLDPPSADSLHTSLDRLYTLGALYSNCTPTPRGLVMSRFRFISLESIAMILSGYSWAAPIEDLITLAAALAIKGDMNQKDTEPDQALRAFGDIRAAKMDLAASCDFITILLAWRAYQETCVSILSTSVQDMPESIEAWCDKNGLSLSFFESIQQNREDIIHSMASIGLNPFQNTELSLAERTSLDVMEWVLLIKQCIFEGYKSNIAVWSPALQKYETRFGRLQIVVERDYLMTPADIIKYGVQNPKYIMYDIVRFRQNPKNEYPAELKYVSVLDGYVPFDPTFDS